MNPIHGQPRRRRTVASAAVSGVVSGVVSGTAPGAVSHVRARDTVREEMYRFLVSPRWLGFHLLVLAGIVAFINFGFWQLDRLDQRREFNSTVSARIDQPAVGIETIEAEIAADSGSGDDPSDRVQWRSVDASGTYLLDQEFIVVNRSQGGRAGDNAVTPMVLADGRILLVNRGFVPLGEAIPPPVAETAEVRGIVRLSEQRRRGQLSDPAEGRLREIQRIDIDRLSQQLPGEVLPFYIDLTASRPAQTTVFPEPVVRPDLSEGSHLSYAAQWFIFATAVAIGWVLAVRSSLAKRRRELSAAHDADRPPPSSAEATKEPQRTSTPSSP